MFGLLITPSCNPVLQFDMTNIFLVFWWYNYVSFILIHTGGQFGYFPQEDVNLYRYYSVPNWIEKIKSQQLHINLRFFNSTLFRLFVWILSIWKVDTSIKKSRYLTCYNIFIVFIWKFDYNISKYRLRFLFELKYQLPCIWTICRLSSHSTISSQNVHYIHTYLTFMALKDQIRNKYGGVGNTNGKGGARFLRQNKRKCASALHRQTRYFKKS